MRVRRYIPAVVGVLFALLSAGACRLADEPVPSQPARLFPADTVCSLPASSSIKKFNFLGSGVWKPLSESDPSAGFACDPELVVELAGVDTGTVNVEYKAGETAAERRLSL